VSSIRAVAVVAGLAVALSACGSSSGPGQSQFVDNVNQICYRTDTALGVSPKSITSLPAFGHEVQRDLPIYLEELKELRAVQVPGGSKSEYSVLLRAVAKQDDLLREAIPPLLANDLKLARKFTGRLPASSTAVYDAETKLNLLVCTKSA
jgi:hypothetical protein